jgi:hypothetical protein
MSTDSDPTPQYSSFPLLPLCSNYLRSLLLFGDDSGYAPASVSGTISTGHLARGKTPSATLPRKR